MAYQISRNERKRYGAEEDCHEASSSQIKQPQHEISSFEWRDQRRDIRLVKVVFLRRRERKNSGSFVVKSSGLRAILLNESCMMMRTYRTKPPLLRCMPIICFRSFRYIVHSLVGGIKLSTPELSHNVVDLVDQPFMPFRKIAKSHSSPTSSHPPASLLVS